MVGATKVRRYKHSCRVPGTHPEAWRRASEKEREIETRQYLTHLRQRQDEYRAQFDSSDPRSKRGLNATPGEPVGLRIAAALGFPAQPVSMAAKRLARRGDPMIQVDWGAPKIVVPLDYWVLGSHHTPKGGL